MLAMVHIDNPHLESVKQEAKDAGMFTSTPAHQDSTIHHGRKSTLVELPGEIRKIIFEYVLGDQLIHMIYHKQGSGSPSRKGKMLHQQRGKFQHAICLAGRSEVTGYKESKSGCSEDSYGKSHSIPSDHFERRDLQCTTWLEAFGVGGAPANRINSLRRIDLSLLGVNRQIHGEATHVLMTTNTFSFSDALTFLRFVDSLSPVQREMLAWLHFAVKWDKPRRRGGRSWPHAMPEHLFTELKGLQNMEICLEVKSKGYKWLRGISIDEPDALDGYLGNGFLRFRYSSIKTVRVSIIDPWGRLKLSQRQRREIADYYETRILDEVE